MIAMPVTGADLARRQSPERSRERFGTLSPATVAADFQPLDPDIVNEAIPAFFIGRNSAGFWVAREVQGRIGGIFLLENSAVSFAKHNSRPAACATIYPTERFELDLENSGNPLLAQVGSLIRLARRFWPRMVALTGK